MARGFPAIPQPGGWGPFTPAYQDERALLSRNPPTGRLGSSAFVLVGTREGTPTCRLGDCGRATMPRPFAAG
jgi:hypothetical protein